MIRSRLVVLVGVALVASLFWLVDGRAVHLGDPPPYNPDPPAFLTQLTDWQPGEVTGWSENWQSKPCEFAVVQVDGGFVALGRMKPFEHIQWRALVTDRYGQALVLSRRPSAVTTVCWA